MRKHHTSQTALDAFMARKAEIDAQLARLQALSDEHFNLSPDSIHWGHVGDLTRYAELLSDYGCRFQGGRARSLTCSSQYQPRLVVPTGLVVVGASEWSGLRIARRPP